MLSLESRHQKLEAFQAVPSNPGPVHPVRYIHLCLLSLLPWVLSLLQSHPDLWFWVQFPHDFFVQVNNSLWLKLGVRPSSFLNRYVLCLVPARLRRWSTICLLHYSSFFKNWCYFNTAKLTATPFTWLLLMLCKIVYFYFIYVWCWNWMCGFLYA